MSRPAFSFIKTLAITALSCSTSFMTACNSGESADLRLEERAIENPPELKPAAANSDHMGMSDADWSTSNQPGAIEERVEGGKKSLQDNVQKYLDLTKEFKDDFAASAQIYKKELAQETAWAKHHKAHPGRWALLSRQLQFCELAGNATRADSVAKTGIDDHGWLDDENLFFYPLTEVKKDGNKLVFNLGN
jgi:hypothetical protein